VNADTVFDQCQNLKTFWLNWRGASISAAQTAAKATMQCRWLKTAKIALHIICHREQFRFKVMSFGLINSGATYSRLQKIVLDGAKSIDNVLDDVILATSKFDEHLLSLRNLFNRLSRANLVLKPSKTYQCPKY